jgi:hypothetical protein
MSITPPQSSPGKKEIIEMMSDFDSSESVSVKEFCEMHGIGPATFRTWNHIYENQHHDKGRSGFVSLEVEALENRSAPAPLFAEVQGIRLYREVSAEYLKALLP